MSENRAESENVAHGSEASDPGQRNAAEDPYAEIDDLEEVAPEATESTRPPAPALTPQPVKPAPPPGPQPVIDAAPPAPPAAPYAANYGVPTHYAAPTYPSYGMQPYPSQPMQPAYGYRREHPQSTTVLILGLLGIAFGIVAPLAWFLGAKARKEIAQGAPYTFSSGAVGYQLGIIFTILNAFFIGFVLLAVIAT